MKNVFYHFWKPERIATPIGELLSRLNLYADIFQKESCGQTLKVLISEKDFRLIARPEIYSSISFIQVSYSNNNLVNLMKIQRAVKRIDKFPGLWIPNDPFKSFGIAVLLKLIFFRKMKIQLQLHGIVPRNLKGGLKPQITGFLLYVSMLFSYSIRTVSQDEFERFRKLKLLRNRKIFLAPVPVNIPEEVNAHKHVASSKMKIISLGRIHEERGIYLLSEIIKSTVSPSSDVEFHIVGAGELLPELRQILSQEIKSGICTVYGDLRGEDLSSVLLQMDTLINCAPIESYGLAMREALMNGVSIFALENQATKALQMQYPAYVILFRNTIEATAMIKERSAFREIACVEALKIRDDFREQNLKHIISVAQSWLV